MCVCSTEKEESVVGPDGKGGVLEGVVERQVKIDPPIQAQPSLAMIREAVVDLSQLVCESRGVQNVIGQLLVV